MTPSPRTEERPQSSVTCPLTPTTLRAMACPDLVSEQNQKKKKEEEQERHRSNPAQHHSTANYACTGRTLSVLTAANVSTPSVIRQTDTQTRDDGMCLLIW